jgi:hypothetical protein
MLPNLIGMLILISYGLNYQLPPVLGALDDNHYQLQQCHGAVFRIRTIWVHDLSDLALLTCG